MSAHPLSGSQRRSGFTLIELMIVVVIIGILAAIAIPKFNQVSRHAKESEATGKLKQLYTLQERYRQATDTYAANMTDLEGGAVLGQTAKYYRFSLAAHASGYCGVATPTAEGVAAGVSPQSIDANRVLYQTGNCS